MSVIGPRPLLVEYLPYYTKEEHHRHDVRPGLSGWAQINGRNAIDSWEQRFQYDLPLTVVIERQGNTIHTRRDDRRHTYNGKRTEISECSKSTLRLVGGKENVVSAAHCATRLRLVLKDESKADVDGILKTELVKGQFSTGGQFQIIIGSGTVDEVYKYFIQYAAMFGSAVGCAYVTLTNVQNISPGAAGIIGFVCIKSGGMLNYMIGILISLVVGFAVTMALSKHPKFKEV